MRSSFLAWQGALGLCGPPSQTLVRWYDLYLTRSSRIHEGALKSGSPAHTSGSTRIKPRGHSYTSTFIAVRVVGSTTTITEREGRDKSFCSGLQWYRSSPHGRIGACVDHPREASCIDDAG